MKLWMLTEGDLNSALQQYHALIEAVSDKATILSLQEKSYKTPSPIIFDTNHSGRKIKEVVEKLPSETFQAVVEKW